MKASPWKSNKRETEEMKDRGGTSARALFVTKPKVKVTVEIKAAVQECEGRLREVGLDVEGDTENPTKDSEGVTEVIAEVEREKGQREKADEGPHNSQVWLKGAVRWNTRRRRDKGGIENKEKEEKGKKGRSHRLA